MNFQSLAIALTVGISAINVLSLPSMAQISNSDYQFFCNRSYDKKTNLRVPTTFVYYNNHKSALILWTKKMVDITPQQRCNEVSQRFQKAYNNGSLNIITNGIMKGQPVICTAKEFLGDCADLLVTLRPNEDSLAVLNQLKDSLSGRGVGAIKQSSGAGQMYIQIDLENAVRNAPIEDK